MLPKVQKQKTIVDKKKTSKIFFIGYSHAIASKMGL